MTDDVLARAHADDEAAFAALVKPYRRELRLHCYHILGSLQDAEDQLQETLLAAWRGLDGFEGRASLRAWLYRIATNRCLNALRDRTRRPQQVPSMVEPPEPTRRSEPIWLEPYPDVLLEGLPDTAPGPEARYDTRESVGLAFLAALHHLPPRQRAALVLHDALGFRTAEVASILDTSEASVKGALQRARVTVDEHLPHGGRDRAPGPNSARESEIAGRFAAAVERGDTDGIVFLLTDDAWLRMPPQPYEYQGGEAIARFWRDRQTLRGVPFRLVPTRANGQPAFGCYLPDLQAPIARAYGLIVLTITKDRISAITWFGERRVLAYFGQPRALPE